MDVEAGRDEKSEMRDPHTLELWTDLVRAAKDQEMTPLREVSGG